MKMGSEKPKPTTLTTVHQQIENGLRENLILGLREDERVIGIF